MGVTVLQIERTIGKAGLLGLATVELAGGIVIRGWRICEGRNGNPRIAVPHRVWFDAGERYSEPLVDLPEPLRWELFDAIRRAWMEGNKGHEATR